MSAPASMLVGARARPETTVIDHPSGFLALSARNELYRARGYQGFVAFREHGRHLFAFGGVHAPPGADAEVLDAWLAEAERRGRRAVAVQVRAGQVALFRSRGFVVNQLGSTFGLDLRRFSMA